MDFSFVVDPYYIQLLLRGLGMTLLLAFLAVLFGSGLGLFPALMRLSSSKILKGIASTYVEVIRGTPMLVQVLLIYAVVKMPVTIILGVDISSFVPGMIALTLNSSAYIAEIFRGGIMSVHSGQHEAALSLGLSPVKTMQHVILPQAIKTILPSLGNEFVTIIKETSIFMYLGITELMYSAMLIKSATYAIKEVYIVVAVMYFMLTFPTSKLMQYVEKRMKKTNEKQNI